MPIQQLDNLVTIGKLKAEAAEQDEINGLVRSGAARITDAVKLELSFESRFDLAYNAAHAFALAALRFHGYRSENRYLVFQALQQTVNLKAEEWAGSRQGPWRAKSCRVRRSARPRRQAPRAVIRIALEIQKRVESFVAFRR
ncbi:MAG: hypothetical protein JWP01_1553 [Myxococcales bacterium]|nr:hypothetical protein [Myxococcales bacterium]